MICAESGFGSSPGTTCGGTTCGSLMPAAVDAVVTGSDAIEFPRVCKRARGGRVVNRGYNETPLRKDTS